ncbi:MAG: hypothetical protein ACK5N0_13025 [Synechococcaceae cyanobacterium]
MKRIYVIHNPVDPTHLQFSARLGSLITSNKTSNLKLEVRSAASDYFHDIEAISAHDSFGSTIIFDLCADPITWRPLNNPRCYHVIVGGFAKPYLQPLSQASGIQEVADRCPHTDLAIVSRDHRNIWTTWLHVSIPTLRHWRHNQKQLVDACADYAFLWLRKSHPYEQLKALGQPIDCHGLRSARTSWLQLCCIAIQYNLDRIRSRLNRAIKPASNWCIGYFDGAQNGPLIPLRITSSNHSVWFADPFVWRDKTNRCWVLCEQFDDEGDQLGEIALFEIRHSQPPLRHGVILKEPFHLSFPRLVEYQQDLYATVESCENHDVRLYKVNCIDQPMQLERILLQGESFIDPMLLHHQDGRWYLFLSTTSAESLKREVAPELRLFVSEDLLEAQFSEHPQSPLMISSRAGRNAGLILQKCLYRVAQQTGFGGVYGESIAFFRIDDLSPTSYHETPVQHLPTGFQPSSFRKRLKASHLHSLNNHGDAFVFDFIPS